MKKTIRRWLWVSGAIMAVAVIGLQFFATDIADYCVIQKYGLQVEFDPTLWASVKDFDGRPTDRQRMIRRLVMDVLPGKSRREIEQLLGPSPTHAGMRRYTQADLAFREKDERGEWKPFPATGNGHYWDEFDWDMLYTIGPEQILIYDHKGQDLSPDREVLLIRLDAADVFLSWYIDGSDRWPRVVGEQVLGSFRARR